ncbi:MAG TPA: hypothetical protein DEB37_19405 [Lysinibacillus sp.]|uniref:hypothetical protein n=1 Tax=Lysinibacillus sp. FSL L8-0126 TaxID=2921515 RepID=UPI000E9FA095|nr:hypothetical protein [Lysinibacillus sp.]
MKNRKFQVFSFFLVCLCLIFFISIKDNKKIETINFEGKTLGFDNLEEMEEASPVIVLGTKTKENDTEVFRSDINNDVIGGYTKSSFLISEVYKNNDNKEDIKTNSQITVSEMAFYDKETNAMYTVNDYENMEFDKEYLLFLVPVDDGMYAPRGVTTGKVPMFGSNSSLNSLNTVDSDNSDLAIMRDAQLKYKK